MTWEKRTGSAEQAQQTELGLRAPAIKQAIQGLMYETSQLDSENAKKLRETGKAFLEALEEAEKNP